MVLYGTILYNTSPAKKVVSVDASYSPVQFVPITLSSFLMLLAKNFRFIASRIMKIVL